MFGRKQSSRLAELEEQEKLETKILRAVRREVKQEFRRRDLWAQRKAEVRRQAAGRKICVLKCAAPASSRRERWGDWHYCRMLQRNLEAAGICTVIDCYDDWYCDSGADLVIVMGGRYEYRPDRRNETCRYVLWVVSHPERITREQCALYDEVWVDSFSGALSPDWEPLDPRTKIRPVVVPVDMDMFSPAEDPEDLRYDYAFVGNSRNVRRNVVDWCEKNGIPLHVWGNEWKKFYPDPRHVIFHGPAEYGEVAEIYRHARVIVNDHFPDMLSCGIVNNRVLEVLACGKPLVSDGGAVLRERFPEGILYYEDEASFLKCLQNASENYRTLRQQVRKHLPAFRREYAASRWAEQVRDILEEQN